MIVKKTVKIMIITILLSSGLLAQGAIESALNPRIPRIPTEAFSPSNTKTVDGKLIGVEKFFSAQRCAYCHQDVYNAWSESLHRNAAREPFYRESADILLKTRGIEFTRHCESCHTPIALLSGALTKGVGSGNAPFTALDHEGVTCTVCHSITQISLEGTGSYTIRPPALLVKEDGTPIVGDMPDSQIMANIPDHKRAMMRPLLSQPELCASCHKVSATPGLNGYKQVLGFSAYDEWQQSGASRETIQSFYPRDERATCQSCHMPKVSASNDLAAKEGKIAFHAWPGANVAAPIFYGQTQQVKVTESFLKNNVVNVDIIGLQSTDSKTLMELSSDRNNSVALKAGQEVTAEVVVANRGAAHSFPPEVRDLYEAWVEFCVVDEKGEKIFHSGFIKEDGFLDQTAHVYKSILLDKNARTITRHQIWLINIKGYDNAIQAGKSDVVHYRFVVPETGKFTMKAKVHYRRVTQDYSNYVLGRQGRSLTLPIIEMASSEKVISLSTRNRSTFQSDKANKIEARRFNDYAIGLLEQGQYGQAAIEFARASQLDPNDSSLIVNIAIAQMRTERFGEEKKQFFKAKELLEKALAMSPKESRARFYKALVLRGLGQINEAVDILSDLAKLHPRDREVQSQLGQTLYSMGKVTQGQIALEQVLAIDPTDANAYQLLAAIYESQGEKEKSKKAQQLYLEWRQDPMADRVASKFYANNPEWAEERINYHVHAIGVGQRPVLTGEKASPVDKPE
jgi:tetratricopeptide (TPR) repeat protein